MTSLLIMFDLTTISHFHCLVDRYCNEWIQRSRKWIYRIWSRFNRWTCALACMYNAYKQLTHEHLIHSIWFDLVFYIYMLRIKSTLATNQTNTCSIDWMFAIYRCLAAFWLPTLFFSFKSALKLNRYSFHFVICFLRKEFIFQGYRKSMLHWKSIKKLDFELTILGMFQVRYICIRACTCIHSQKQTYDWFYWVVCFLFLPFFVDSKYTKWNCLSIVFVLGVLFDSRRNVHSTYRNVSGFLIQFEAFATRTWWSIWKRVICNSKFNELIRHFDIKESEKERETWRYTEIDCVNLYNARQFVA